MWQRFTERARRVVFFAQEEAARWGENFVGTEHLLLGLVRESDSVAGKILGRLGIDRAQILHHLESQMTRGHGNLGQDMQLTPRAKRVIDLAYEEARALANNYIGTEHLLLGLIREGGGLGARVLNALNADLECTRSIVRTLQAEGSTQQAAQKGAEPEVRAEKAPPPPPGDPRSTARLLWQSTDPAPRLPWVKFDERARRAAYFAQDEAVRHGWNRVGTEHLLLGLVRERENTAAQILERLDVSVESIREAIDQQARRGQHNPEQPMEPTPRARRALELAYEEAQALGHNHIGTEHLLIGLLRASPSDEGAASSEPPEGAPTPAPRAAEPGAKQRQGPEGVVGTGPDAAWELFAQLGVDLERARQVFQAGGFLSPPATDENYPFLPPPWMQPTEGRLTDGARRVILFAHAEAQRYGYTEVAPDFLLLGLACDDNLASRVLTHMGIPPERVQSEVERRLRDQSLFGALQRQALREPGWSPELKLSLDTQRIIELAREEARSMGQTYLGAEHLLLGFLREARIDTAKLLIGLGAGLERARQELPVVGPKWAAILEARRRVEEAEAAYRALLPMDWLARGSGARRDHESEQKGVVVGQGVLEILPEGWGFLRRHADLVPAPNDIYVSQAQIHHFGLKSGDWVSGKVRPPQEGEKYYGLIEVEAVN